ncbi:MAG: hypothetical protein A3A61_04335 [Candidatus Woykebacteria bacterium RIFCSPLOWO2_01_FULL_43_14]|uniref:Uncharacterized protein n=2 Tax=Candidatus Woykeibacteriota TaxID=1817899 RepID=A0A1G1WYS2_9BACT|nr:MAG: hypothetical protein A3J50_02635 [Candidatus Woykebacteria bacterium RIFCSPHIGHO2_02_FULL_43_16b]OGY32287.1 MAG: hypothetical protein A3A61_04335 [Candidatus Woykebacteria bacterium RIFCSPLOWO2_01_FULL_43_14]
MTSQKFKLKKDSFSDARGSYSRFLNIYCDHCGSHILLYQKDGPGPLKRLYQDRVFAPQNIVSPSKPTPLVCSACRSLIAIPAIYEKENRPAYLLLSYAFIKKVGTGEYPPKKAKLDVG